MDPKGMHCKTYDRRKKVFGSQRGSILIYLIAVLVIAGVLGTGIVSLTTTSKYTGLGYNPSDRARYLALSGVKYAQWAWDLKDTYDPLNFSGWDPQDENTVPDDKKIVLSDNQGEIELTFISDDGRPQVESTGSVLTGTFRESSFKLKKNL